MNSLWLCALLLLGLALLFVMLPIWRYRASPDEPAGGSGAKDEAIRRQQNLEAFRQRLEELEQDWRGGALPAEEYEQLKTELQRRLLEDMDMEAEREMLAQVPSKRLALVCCLLFVPLFSLGFYDFVGAARDLPLPGLIERVGGAETAAQRLQALEELADFLQRRFERNEGDVQNAYTLGTLHLDLENYPAAVAVFSRLADELEPGAQQAAVLGQLAQAHYLAADSAMSPAAQGAAEAALALNPNEYAVMGLLAIEAFIKGNFREAIGYWRRQLAQREPEDREAVVLRDRIQRVETLLAAAPEAEVPQPAPAAPALEAPQAAPAASLAVRIDLDDSIAPLVNEDMRLFVFARNPAMPMPLAAVNLPASGFPLELTLDDSMAMIENLNLSSADQVIVGARISRSGQATAQSGDFEAISEPFPLAGQDEPLSLLIKDIVP